MHVTFIQAQPFIPVKTLNPAVAFYEILGFLTVHRNQDIHQVMSNGAATIHLSTVVSAPAHCQIVVDDVDAVHGHYVSLGIEISHKLQDQIWGCRDFSLCDPDGNQMTFAQHIEL
ncbi:MAG: VOC family protein [Planctomycetes bacterium]|nr:VOC family protein [Planctomycetota bacterium]